MLTVLFYLRMHHQPPLCSTKYPTDTERFASAFRLRKLRCTSPNCPRNSRASSHVSCNNRNKLKPKRRHSQSLIQASLLRRRHSSHCSCAVFYHHIRVQQVQTSREQGSTRRSAVGTSSTSSSTVLMISKKCLLVCKKRQHGGKALGSELSKTRLVFL